jgi:hypothetical protein
MRNGNEKKRGKNQTEAAVFSFLLDSILTWNYFNFDDIFGRKAYVGTHFGDHLHGEQYVLNYIFCNKSGRPVEFC